MIFSISVVVKYSTFSTSSDCKIILFKGISKLIKYTLKIQFLLRYLNVTISFKSSSQVLIPNSSCNSLLIVSIGSSP